MQPLPHRYTVTTAVSAGSNSGEVDLATTGVAPLRSAAPAEFDGPGTLWSPETLFVAAAADCFAITFRGVARASKLAWDEVTCDVTGTLDRVDGVMRFTELDIDVRLTVPEGIDPEYARRVIEKVERTCLITNSLNATVRLHPTIEARTIGAHERAS